MWGHGVTFSSSKGRMTLLNGVLRQSRNVAFLQPGFLLYQAAWLGSHSTPVLQSHHLFNEGFILETGDLRDPCFQLLQCSWSHRTLWHSHCICTANSFIQRGFFLGQISSLIQRCLLKCQSYLKLHQGLGIWSCEYTIAAFTHSRRAGLELKSRAGVLPSPISWPSTAESVSVSIKQ